MVRDKTGNILTTISFFPVKVCKKFGQVCARGRKCIPCYLRNGLCCRRASLIGGWQDGMFEMNTFQLCRDNVGRLLTR